MKTFSASNLINKTFVIRNKNTGKAGRMNGYYLLKDLINNESMSKVRAKFFVNCRGNSFFFKDVIISDK